MGAFFSAILPVASLADRRLTAALRHRECSGGRRHASAFARFGETAVETFGDHALAARRTPTRAEHCVLFAQARVVVRERVPGADEVARLVTIASHARHRVK